MKKAAALYLGLPCLLAFALACGLAWGDLSTSFQRSQDTRGSFGTDSTGTHFLNVGPAPVLTLCGTSPTVAGTDSMGTITVGSAVGSLSCNIAFATAWGAAPNCLLVWETVPTGPTYSTATNGVFASWTGNDEHGLKIHYYCSGQS
jgi:hypothetical protein